MTEIKTGSKWIALPIIGKIAKFALDIIIILGVGAMVAMGSQVAHDASEQMEPLIESGALPECVRNLPMGLAMMMMGGIILLLWIYKRK